MTTFRVSLYHGVGNKERTQCDVITGTAHNAVWYFMQQYFPSDESFPLRWEQPEDGSPVWSAGTTASGQRIYVRVL